MELNNSAASVDTNNTFSSNYTGDVIEYVIYDLAFSSHVISIFISVFTILFNIVIIISARSLKRSLPDVVVQQLSCMAWSDLVAGITPSLWCLTMFESVNTNARACTAIYVTFFMAQYATLLNICFLSAKRWSVLAKVSMLRGRPTSRISAAFILTTSAWVISVIIALPGITSVTKSTWINGCFSPVFIDDPTALMCITLLHLVTLFVLDGFCICCICVLNKTSSLVRPTTNVMSIPENNANQNIGPDREREQRDLHQLTIAGLPNQRNRLGETSNTMRVAQRRAFQHLLLAVIVINVSTLPFFAIFLLQLMNVLDFYAIKSIIDIQLLSLNSLLNPIVYGFHVSEVRALIIEKVITTRNRFIGVFFGSE